MTGSCLIYGYGNPGRQDDGLGPALVEELEKWITPGLRSQVVLDSNYQLNAEDALTISGYETVIFVDAAISVGAPLVGARGRRPATPLPEGGFSFRPLTPEATIAFSTHAMSPGTVLALCEELYGKHPAAYLLAIRGYSWEPNATMTPEATANLAVALIFIKSRLIL